MTPGHLAVDCPTCGAAVRIPCVGEAPCEGRVVRARMLAVWRANAAAALAAARTAGEPGVAPSGVIGEDAEATWRGTRGKA